MTSPDELMQTPVRTQADLEALWRSLMEPLGFSRGSLWLMRIGPDDLPVPGMVQLDDDDGDAPDPAQMPALADLLLHLDHDFELAGARWAFLRSRPGHGGVRASDRALAAALLAACREKGLATDVMHLATDDRLVPLPYDELARTA